MSLATRCTACGTVFRVVEDQLKVSEGWVRCGRCQQVFNAVESLFDLEREAPPPWTPPVPARTAEATEPAARARAAPAAPPGPDPELTGDSGPVDLLLDLPDDRVQADSSPGSLFDALIDGRPAPPPSMSAGDVDIDIDDADEASEGPEATDPVDILLDDVPPADLADSDATVPYRLTREAAPRPQTGPAPAPMAPEHGDADDADERAGPPTFMVEADRAQRWRSSPLRVAYAVAALVLAVALVLQVALHFRDTLAAAWPEARSTLAGLCQLAGCTLQPPRRIDSVTVESSGLTRSADGSGYKLSIVLQNKAAYAVAVPSIDLSLTDTAGQVIARRVLNPSDFKGAPEALKPSGVTTLELTMSSGSRPIVGYAVEVFYP